MTDRVIFDFPVISVLFMRRKEIMGAKSVVLFINDDSYVPSVLLRLFIFLARLIVRQDIDIKRANMKDFICYGQCAAKIMAAYRPDPKLINWIARLASGNAFEAEMYIKKVLTEKVRFQVFVKHEAKNKWPDESVLIVSDLDLGKVYQNALADVTTGCTVAFRVLASFMTLVGLPLNCWTKLSRFRFALRRQSAVRASLGVQMVNFQQSMITDYSQLSYLYDTSDCIAVITRVWRPPPVVIDEFIASLEDRSIRYVDLDDASATAMDWLVGSLSVLGLSATLFGKTKSWSELFVCLKAAGSRIDEGVQTRNLPCNVLLCFDDYSDTHIVRSWACHTVGIRTMGVSHSMNNGTYGNPSNAYVVFDRYLVWSDFQKALMAPYWSELRVIDWGYDRIDRIIKNRNAESLDARSILGWGNDQKNIIFTLRDFDSIAHLKRICPAGADLIRFLDWVAAEEVAGVQIFLRPKKPNGVAAMRDRYNGTSVTILTDDRLKTADYLAVADLVVASDGSAILSDCALLKTPVICFDYNACSKTIFDEFGSDMYNQTFEELKEIISKVSRGAKLDVDFEAVWRDLSFPYVSNRGAQMRQIVKDVILEKVV